MFTGIIQEVGAVRSSDRRGTGRRIECSAPALAQSAMLGESIAVNGVCLTLVSIGKESFAMDAVEETLERSTLSRIAPGAKVNLERALRAGEPMGGHLVQGHVDCVGKVLSMENRGESWILRIRHPAEFDPLVVPKGSIAIDGVSLTIAALAGGGECALSIIPFTRENTIVSSYRPGMEVNLEFDIIGKYILHALRSMQGEGALTAERLRELGY